MGPVEHAEKENTADPIGTREQKPGPDGKSQAKIPGLKRPFREAPRTKEPGKRQFCTGLG